MSDTIYQVATWLIPLIIAIVFHEVAHGWVARAFGDPTAGRLGRLSFNPIRHVDPIGTIVIPLGLAIAGAPIFGWAKAVPVDKLKLRNPRLHMMLVALAGPGMNFLLAALAFLALGGLAAGFGQQPGPTTGFISANLINFAIINVMLAVFNLLPLPPFDGGHVVEGLLPAPLARRYARLARYGFPIMIVLLVALPMLSPEMNIVPQLIGPPVNWILGLGAQFLSHFG
jgi:Zn-dependent protease